MNASLRPLIFELVVHHRRVHKFAHLKLPDLIAVPEHAYDVAKESSTSPDKELADLAVKVLEGLALINVTSGTGGASAVVKEVRSAPASVPARAVAAAIPATGNGRSYDREWERLETLAVDEAGPMGSQLVRKVRTKNPGVDPATLKSKVSEVLGSDLAAAIYDKYRSR